MSLVNQAENREDFFAKRLPGFFHDGETNTLFVHPINPIARTDAPNITQFCLGVHQSEVIAIKFYNATKRAKQKGHTHTLQLRFGSLYQSLINLFTNTLAELNRIHAHTEIPPFQKKIALAKCGCFFLIVKEIQTILGSPESKNKVIPVSAD